jgi:hypothetical protein
MSNANHHQDSLGLPVPSRQAAGTSPLDAPPVERDGYEYTLPQRIMFSPAWQRYAAGKFTERDLVFVMGEPSAKDEADANKFAPNNTINMLSRLEQLCLTKIGDRLVRRNQTLIDDWYRAIGRPGRAIVEATFMRMYQVDPAEVEGVLAEGKPVTV